ncbi:MAG: DNA polymerase I, partial [candidate division Zixibacteria bacterium]|nr:DNA polymerase I [candidate division Zixibacteria bacterium]
FDVWCVTGDKDFFQLVTDQIKIYYPRRGSESPDRLGREEVKAKFGVYPERVIDKLALMGDSSDNVPGVAGIGPKTADKLLEQFGSFDATLEGYHEIKAKGVREKIAAGIEEARLSRKLVTIDTDVPIPFEIDQIKRRAIDYAATKSLFIEMEFAGLLKQIMPDGGGEDTPEQPSSDVKVEYETITSTAMLNALLTELSQLKEVAVDTETTSLNALEAELVGVSLCAQAGVAYYIPLGHSGADEKNLPFDEALVLLKKFLENPGVQKFGQNIKYDIEVLHRFDIDIHPVSFDSMLASYLLNPSGREHSLDFLAMKHCDHKMQPITELIGSGKKQTTFDTVAINRAAYYAAEDADYTYRLRGTLAPEIDRYELENLF